MFSRLLKAVTMTVIIFCFVPVAVAFQGKLAPSLEKRLAAAETDRLLPVIILMEERPDLELVGELVRGAERDHRSEIVWDYLVQLSEASQADIREMLSWETDRGRATDARVLRSANAIVLKAQPDLVRAVAQRRDVWRILDDSIREHPVPQGTGYEQALDELDELGWNLERIGVDIAWADGYRGEGILVAHIDTGANFTHLDLADRLWDGGEEYPNGGWDFYNEDNEPEDIDGHGTQVAGILAGDGTAGDTTGIAPQVTLMILKVRETLALGTVTDTWLAHDFCIENGVDVTQMSLGWGNPGEGDMPIWRDQFNILDAAGIANVKSSGNNRGVREPPNAISAPGSVPSPWRSPDEIEEGTRSGLITVGGVDSQDSITFFSSPGPSTWQDYDEYGDYPWDGENHYGLIKPDIAAPGVNIPTISAWDSTDYGVFGMSSSTAPHISGVICLMLCKDSRLLPVEIDSILQTTAYDLGPDGKDNDYGAGLVQAIDALDAIPVPMGSINGLVTNANDGAPMENAVVWAEERPRRRDTTDVEGGYEFEIQTGTYVIRARYGRNPVVEEAGVVINEGEATELDITVPVGIMEVEPDSISVTLTVDNPVEERNVTFSNPGTASFRAWLMSRPVVEDTIPAYFLYRGFSITDALPEASYYGGIGFAGEEFLVPVAVEEDTNRILRFTPDGEYTGYIHQPGHIDEHVGMQDLAFDGQCIWGGISSELYRLDVESGEVVSTLEGPYVNHSAMTYDPENEWLWVGNNLEHLLALDPSTGEVMDTIPHNRMVTGLAWDSDDPDGLPLQIAVRRGNSTRMLFKSHPDMDEIIFSRDLPAESGDLRSLTVAFPINRYFKVIAGLLEMEDDTRLTAWKVESRLPAVSIESDSLDVEPDGEDTVQLSFTAENLPNDTYRGYILIESTADDETRQIPVRIEIDIEQESTGDYFGQSLPERFTLEQPYPNPFNRRARVRFDLPQAGKVRIRVYDILGREVCRLFEGRKPAGRHQLHFDASRIASGLYFIEMETEGFQAVKKMVLLK